MRRLFFTVLLAATSCGVLQARPQEEPGYLYEVPENPLVIARPTPAAPPAPANDEPSEAASESRPDSQQPPQQQQQQDDNGGSHDHGHAHGGDPLDWLRESVPGEPEVDYPIFAQPPETSFTCDGKDDGMYADVEARCQVWHQCFGDRSWAFLCPNGTIFNQQIFTCVWWFDFDCSTAENFYSLNADLYAGAPESGADSAAESNTLDSRPSNTPVREPAPAPARKPAPAPIAPAAPKIPIAPAPAPIAPAPAPLAPAPAPIDILPDTVQYDDTYDDQYDPDDIDPDQAAPALVPAPANIPSPAPPPSFDNFAPSSTDLDLRTDTEADSSYQQEEGDEEGYNYPVPENPLVLPERPQVASESRPVAVAPLALYGAPAQPFELPPDALPAAAPASVESDELGLAQYSGARQGRRLAKRGKKIGQRRKRLSTKVEGAQWHAKLA